MPLRFLYRNEGFGNIVALVAVMTVKASMVKESHASFDFRSKQNEKQEKIAIPKVRGLDV